MPVYEYVCKACDHEFEKLTPLASAHLTSECPKCGAKKGERVLSMTSPGVAGSTGKAVKGSSCGHMGFG